MCNPRSLVSVTGVVAWGWLLGFVVSPAQGQCISGWTSGGVLPGLDDTAYATAVYDDGSGPALYVGGCFTLVGDVAVNNIAKWNGTSWSPLGSGATNGIDGSVSALTVYNGQLIAAGAFSTAGGASVNSIARWNGTFWSPLSSAAGNGVNGGVGALAVYNDRLIVGGQFTSAGGVGVNSIAQWDGSSWSPLGSGASNGVSGSYPLVEALTVYNGQLIAGGRFYTAGGQVSFNWARWTGCPLPAADFNSDGHVDEKDSHIFATCATGPGVPHDGSETCQQADLDHDNDVDQSDFGMFQRCLTGEDVPADPACAG